MKSIWFVTRHLGAIDWLRRQGIAPDHVVDHLADADLEAMRVGDLVVGSLPFQVVADLTRRGVRYQHVALDLSRASRGVELDAVMMEQYNARLEEYRVEQIEGAR